jgi:hypothetical protein
MTTHIKRLYMPRPKSPWKRLYILYTGEIPDKVDSIRRHFADDPDVSRVIEYSLVRLEQDMKQLTPGDWDKYAGAYNRLRGLVPRTDERAKRHAGEKQVHLSEKSLKAIQSIFEYASETGVASVKHGHRGINQRLIVTIALLYTADVLAA